MFNLPEKIAYREYNNEMAILLDLKKEVFQILSGNVYVVWKKLLSSNSALDDKPELKIAKKLCSMGLLRSTEVEDIPSKKQDQQTKNPFEMDLIEQFALENKIPISGHLELTGKCNLRCRHCYIVHERAHELTTDQVIKLLHELADSGVLGLVLTGGESFTRGDMPEILKCLSALKFAVRINTNGTLLNDAMLREISECPAIYRVHVSLYAADANIHDSITTVRGSYQKTLTAIQCLSELGVNVRINCCVLKSNWDHYHQVKSKIGDRLGIETHFDPVIVPKDDGDRSNLVERIDNEKISAFFHHSFSNHSISHKIKPSYCTAGFAFFAITDTGELYPCLKMKRTCKKPIGNVLNTPFSQLWYSEQLENLRNEVLCQRP